MSYSSDVFFKPWVGLDYPYGWRLDTANNKIVRCTDCRSCTINKSCANKNKSFKVMVLGLEHYCKDNHNMNKTKDEKTVFDSTDYSNAGHNPMKCCYSNCAHLFTCKDKTESVIKEHIFADDEEAAKAMDVWWQPPAGKTFREVATKVSQANFEKIFNATQNNLETKDIWNSLLFSNFFQRGMPNVDSGKNAHTVDEENKRAFRAFKNIIEIHKPNIVFVWGKKITVPIVDDKIKDYIVNLNICKKLDLKIELKGLYKQLQQLTKKKRQSIENAIKDKIDEICKDDYESIPNFNGKLWHVTNDYNVLLAFVEHPSRFCNTNILPAFQVAENLRNQGLL